MAKNDLNTPMHRKGRERPGNPRRYPLFAPLLISFALVLAVVAAFWIAIVDDPHGGRPVAVATIADSEPAVTGSVASAADVDDTSKPAAAGPQLARLPASPPAIGARSGLFENSAHGPLPRTAPDGRRPRDVYARNSPPLGPGVPRIAIVVGGMGLSQTGTLKAIEALPEDVTLAFAPYGFSLQRWVTKAREEGHEVLLQIPLEPENYPQENPGEHTLLAAAGGGNRDNLHWVLSRITGYAGVMNYMGARFTSDKEALLPVLGEIGARGLFFLDDGSSERSLTGQVGEAVQLSVARADRIVDGARQAAEIERELTMLEVIARSRGVAIGVASAFPTSVDTIARWAKDARDRGIVLIPVSAAL